MRPDPALIEMAEKMGVHRCLFPLPPASADENLPRLDKLAGVMAKLA